MDRNQTFGTVQSRISDVDIAGPDSRTETLPIGPTGTDGTIETIQTHRTPSTGTSTQDRASSISPIQKVQPLETQKRLAANRDPDQVFGHSQSRQKRGKAH
ncbi:hypothetical protein F2Q69_00043046 [Brassica cretica]|uniref:Uncharacterized protein n=1 Tax=Brassica cretica TaxID=69181 RepID=A0A8S9NMF5_BRACR|nr:hypothetical protein F2Q69_00043046 [Brassica cretica]